MRYALKIRPLSTLHFRKQIAILSLLSTFRLSIASITLQVTYVLTFLNYAQKLLESLRTLSI